MSRNKNNTTIRLDKTERRRLYNGLHKLAMGSGDPTLPDRVPDLCERAKSLSDNIWSPPKRWESTEIQCNNLDLWVIFNACFECNSPVQKIAKVASNKYEPNKPPIVPETEVSESSEDVSLTDSTDGETTTDPTEAGPIKYNERYRRNRQKALKRADYECQDCGMSRKEHNKKFGTDLNAHHQKPVSEFDDYDEAHDLSNLRILCLPCHQERHQWMNEL